MLNNLKDEKRQIQKQLQNLRYIQKVIKMLPDDDFTLKFAEDYSASVKKIKQEAKPKKEDSRKIN